MGAPSWLSCCTFGSMKAGWYTGDDTVADIIGDARVVGFGRGRAVLELEG